MAKVVKINLSKAGIDLLKTGLRAEKKLYRLAAQNLVKELCLQGKDEVKKEIDSLNINDTGKLRKSVNKKVTTKAGFRVHGVIYARMPYAKYVEYGWGLGGSMSQHPDFNGNAWVYDMNGKGLKGYISRPFMYYAAEGIRADVPSVAKKVFKG